MLEILRNSKRFFLFGTAAAIILRLIFIFRFPSVTTDSFIYGDIAKNWLQHGVYGLTFGTGVLPTYIRLPGYPAFLAGIFAVFGMEHYRAVLFVQMLVDVGTCFLIANLAWRVFGPPKVKAAFLLAALCPFLANYAAAALTETVEVFFTTLALYLAACAIESKKPISRWIGCGLATGAAMVIRPDGGILLVAIELFLLWSLIRRDEDTRFTLSIAGMLIVGVLAVAPLVPWTLRNLHTMHRFQPLAPRYANEVDEFVPMGFNRWTKTWIADYASVEEIYWSVPGNKVDSSKLPDRAFDSPREREETERLFDIYNQTLSIDPSLDSKFAELASARIHNAPLRYYIWLPALRIADMWLRPRTEMLPSDSRWWEFNDDLEWSILAIGLALVGIFYVSTAVIGVWKTCGLKHVGLLLTFVIIRSMFLGTLESPEPRYVLECYPVVIVWAAAAFPQLFGRKLPR